MSEQETKIEAAVAVEPTVTAEVEKPQEDTKVEDAPAAPSGETAEQSEQAPSEDTKEQPEVETVDAVENTESATTESSDNILKTTAKHSQDGSKNTKFDPSVLPESNDPNEIRKQVEFYFSDSNLSQDKFLWTQVGGTENKPMKLSVIHNFGRMRRFKSYEAVVAALRESKVLDVAGEAGEETIVRKNAYDPARGNKSMVSSVYVKGFGDEEPDTQIKLEKFFGDFGFEISSVRLRRTDKKLFKGSVFVEFASPEEAKKFLELDPKPKWQDHDLKIMSKIAYCEEKNEQIRAGVIKPSERQAKFYEGKVSGARGGRGNSRGGNGNFNKREGGDKKDFGGRGGRGGRGRGRDNGRGRGRGARGGSRGGFRGGQRDGEKEAPREAPKPSNGNDVKPMIHSSAPSTNGKRARDSDSSAQEPPAKKVDTGSS
ncbi:hypothetical protein MCOR27_001203 [Pyricularia oryzae]|uniref:Uncharacterized protein n=5 Tax=Pyricularia TaxID=48558 RepID=A0ABQ8NIA2_PYRGI|nr:uncharacterized protein MGG_01519 [Pyricularia oryzae 70-15]ELQ45024.1 hypothetical protein OOU_Y34scaffold00022g12 [Pyricularia oryzae Y34]KAH8838916.1 hypothetical protein MCOR01_008161 [Pyricularia oryzae]KAI6297571.1 hypothetical protein MCOR33_006156 [Pyricularia grisea]EHA54686.1 hypothetical protein MGG_01519 [Pyricularia oryzae 70-15]KAH9438748.1 hypothetical protein MCOR02_002351 [Pyricularia oryzae]